MKNGFLGQLVPYATTAYSPYTTDESEQENTVGTVGGSPQKAGKFTWKVEKGSGHNFRALGRRLAAANPNLYRNGATGHGLLSVGSDNKTRLILKGKEMIPVITDCMRMIVTKDGKTKGELPPVGLLQGMLESEMFLREFRAVDEVSELPIYLDDFRLAASGLNIDDQGEAVLYLGKKPTVAKSTDTITRFLDTMEFASNADRTNAVGAALTVLLRRFWPGAKPLVLVTATKSHAGKGTIIDFVRGRTAKAEILYEKLDWPMQSQCQRHLQANPAIGLINFDNVRLDSAGGGGFIRGGFVESFITNAEISLAAPGVGQFQTKNQYVVAINTNDGTLSADLLNRALPIHLAPKGSVHDRPSAIGNPKLEYLPQNQVQIESELHGMIQRWKDAGQPLVAVRHSMTTWAQTIGGILKVNGFTDFLGNYVTARLNHDPMRQALGILGAAFRDKPKTPTEWGNIVRDQGLASTLFKPCERDTEKGRARAFGVLMSKYKGETVEGATDTARYQLLIDGGNRRWGTNGTPHVRWVFRVTQTTKIVD